MTAAAAPAPLPAEAAVRALGRAALAALREELETDPKPGLVGPVDRGAHRDMDAGTFRASIAALGGYFREVARAGWSGAPFEALRALGLRAEARMLRATGGVNTHRGAIFTLGILTAVAGRLRAEGVVPGAAALRDALRREPWPSRLAAAPRARASHGSVVLSRHGVGGARAEAAAGFPHLFDVALPALEDALARGASRRAAAVQCLLAVVAVLPDTNLLYRGGEEGLAYARSAARDLLAAGGVRRPGWEEGVRGLHRDLSARGLSPGGSADLLSAALFVHRLTGPPGRDAP